MNMTMEEVKAAEFFIDRFNAYSKRTNPWISAKLSTLLGFPLVAIIYDDKIKRCSHAIDIKRIMMCSDVHMLIKTCTWEILNKVYGDIDPVLYDSWVAFRRSHHYYLPQGLTLESWVSAQHKGIFLEASSTTYRGFILPSRFVPWNGWNVTSFVDYLIDVAEDLQGEIEEFFEENNI